MKITVTIRTESKGDVTEKTAALEDRSDERARYGQAMDIDPKEVIAEAERERLEQNDWIRNSTAALVEGLTAKPRNKEARKP